jgi:rhodanese-related sulfurtransferase
MAPSAAGDHLVCVARAIPTDRLQDALRTATPPLVIDVRRRTGFLAATDMVQGALRRDPEMVAAWAAQLPRSASVVVYCAHGRDVSQRAADELALYGNDASYLEGGIESGWRSHGGALDPKPAGASTCWITRERPKIDRIACPWLIARFIDPAAKFLYVPPSQVLATALGTGAIPYDVPDVPFSHDGGRCSFDAFLAHYRLEDPALVELATIVRGADTGDFYLAPQAPGLLAVSLGLSRMFPDDHEMLRHGMVVYDALYAWCKSGKDEVHTWNPDAYRTPAAT